MSYAGTLRPQGQGLFRTVLVPPSPASRANTFQRRVHGLPQVPAHGHRRAAHDRGRAKPGFCGPPSTPSQFDRIIAAMSLEPESDSFLVNREGRAPDPVPTTTARCWTRSPWPCPFRPPTSRTVITGEGSRRAATCFLAYTFFSDSDFVLIALSKPSAPTPLRPGTWCARDLIFHVPGRRCWWCSSWWSTKWHGHFAHPAHAAKARKPREQAFHHMEHNAEAVLDRAAGRRAWPTRSTTPWPSSTRRAGLMKD